MQRFNIEQDSADARKYIRSVQGVNEKGDRQVKFHWEWPKDPAYNYCFAFAVSEAEDRAGVTLGTLLDQKRMPEIISQTIAYQYTLTLTNRAQRVIFYPARLEKDQYYIVDQRQGNRSEYLQKKLEIAWRVQYENLGGFFSSLKLKKAQIHLSFSQTEKPDTCLVYRCKGGGRDDKRFGIDLAQMGRGAVVEIVLLRQEEIVFEEPAGEYAKAMKLKAAGR